MNVLLVTIGTLGDLLPLIVLGTGLRERGHRVTVVSFRFYEELVRRAGLAFVGVLDFSPTGEVAGNPGIWDPRRGARLMMDAVYVPATAEVYRVIERAFRPGTVVAATTLAFGARVAEEKLGVPLVTIHLQPYFFFSREDPPVSHFLNLPRRVPGPLAAMLWKGAYGAFERAYLGGVNRFRAGLGLPRAKGLLTRWVHSPRRVLGFFPEWFAAPAADWPPQTRLTGFVGERGRGWPEPPGLEEFLEAGEPPVVFTPGTAVSHAKGFFASAVEACRALGLRAVFLTLHHGQLPPSLPPGAVHFDYVPLGRLLPRAAALVHHGGVGTAAQGLAAGVPQLTMPMNYDQADNASRLGRLGVGAALPSGRFTGKAVAGALEGLLSSDRVARRCRELAGRVDFERALDRACGAVEEAGGFPEGAGAP